MRTFHPRRGRLSGRHVAALDRLWPTYGLVIPYTPLGNRHDGCRLGAPAAQSDVPAMLDPVTLFGRQAPLVLEIGSGMGDATAEMAATDTGRDYLAVEVHTPGIANLLALIEERRLANVRIARGDALDLLRHGLPEESLDAVHVFFPDPWPKVRHHKRRLIQPDHVALLRSRLAPGGTLHCATDWAEYAEAMLQTMNADPELVNVYENFAPRPAHRPVTRFEQRARTAGRAVFDLIFRRVQP
ncbi:MAG TPA: tRNA (guanosine(46)-N7)-methyltransferase TrmB [Micromonosporaceae bacterium]|nr:tRNA (guanosine(46)-N7)-methyltransferase TrmB [Micromonosporaceae bacterium]